LLIELLEDRTVPSTLLVTTTADENIAGDNALSLREAIAQANADASNPINPQSDTISFAAPLGRATITLNPDLGQLELTGGNPSARETIDGGGRITVSGGDKVRVFYISPSTTATIAGLTITLGRAYEAPETVVLRCHGGGILNDTGADLTLTDDFLLHNTAQGFKDAGNGPLDESRHLGGGAGGGVANRGTLKVTDSTFIDNQALGFNGQPGDNLFPNLSGVRFPGIALGGGLWSWETGTATVTDSRFIDNLAQGGSYSTGSFAGLANGGAIYNDHVLHVTGSLFSGNRAVGGSHITDSDALSGPATGGAISSGTNERLIGDPVSAELTVSQSIFSHNQAQGGDGNFASKVPQGLASAGGVLGGGIVVFQGVATISQSVLDHNQAIGGNGAAGQVGGTVAGGGIVFVNFLPGLMGEGVMGTVEGCALLQNEAIGGTGGAGARDGNALGGGISAGTFGLGNPLHPLLGKVKVISNTLVAGNLARGGALGGGLFNDAGETLIVEDVAVSKNMAIGDANAIPDAALGPGVASGGGVYNRGTLTVSGSTFTRNQVRGASGSDGNPGKYSYAGVAIGGGLANTGEAKVTDSQFTDNLAQGGDSCKGPVFAGVAGGGAVANTGFFAYATLTVSGSSFSHNRAVGGNDNESGRLPGFGVGGAIFSHRFSKGAVLHFSDSTVDHNLAIGGNYNQQTVSADAVFGPNFAAGGGVFIAGRIIAGSDDTINTISGSTFDHNQAIGGQGVAGKNGGEGHGGGIGVGFAGTVVEVSNSTVEHNLAVGGRAGVSDQAGVSGNGGDARGGGIFNEGGAVLTVADNSFIEHNQARGVARTPAAPRATVAAAWEAGCTTTPSRRSP
jgi:hypothetical protein